MSLTPACIENHRGDCTHPLHRHPVKPYYIVVRVTYGAGDSVTWYHTGDGWAESESAAMRFPQRALADMYARRSTGQVLERVSC